ncbi:Uncharacterized protein FKW44_003460 [Caligus rogercresseyi]|uniref:Uncharacterized protein n=1 Tax=Caligus rogercresseyi TaxID=217165 RepID=A0A7T8KLN3_CALRO|nr:Uncharacterized protein FKW44_003460 [Caligus rogercresseyi]
MEQTRRDTVIELLCAGHRPAAVIKLPQYPRKTVYDITKKGRSQGCPRERSTIPGVTGSARPHLWLVSRVSQGQSGDTHGDPLQELGSTCRRPLDRLSGLRDPVHLPAGLGARPQGQTCASWL